MKIIDKNYKIFLRIIFQFLISYDCSSGFSYALTLQKFEHIISNIILSKIFYPIQTIFKVVIKESYIGPKIYELH